MEIPETRYVKTQDGVHIAYSTLGDGPIDIVYIPGFVTHLELQWEIPHIVPFLRRLAELGRLIMFDKRGTGLSDRASPLVNLDTRAEDMRAVLDEVGSERAVIFGAYEGGALGAFFAATHPDRVSALVWRGAIVRSSAAGDLGGMTPEENERELELMDRAWGSLDYARTFAADEAPILKDDPAFIHLLARWQRFSAAPGEAVAFQRMWFETDVTAILPSIQVPTLILNRASPTDPRYLTYAADRIAGAQLVELRLGDEIPVTEEHREETLRPLQDFILSVGREQAEFDRVLATVMFTDIVGSTDTATRLGDHEWKDLLERHHGIVRAMIGRYRGREVSTAGDGFFATFDGPARGVRCAQQIVEAVQPLGLEVRAGVHTGEVATIDGEVGGLGVVIGARIGAEAGASEVLVSQTVKDLVAGSGLMFEERGVHTLKGVPDEWRLYAATS